MVFLLLRAKLGLFPFFYWIIVVRLKIGIIGNLFVLRFQKIRVFWLLWLLIKSNLGFIYLFVYASIFFVIINLLIITDLWLLLVYSSIANTGMIILRVYGSNYVYVIFLYLGVIFGIIYIIMKIDSYIELLLLVFFYSYSSFFTFFYEILYYFKIRFYVKARFFLALFDVFVLLYYFRIIFIKFLLIDLRILIYLMNLLLLLLILVFRNCVAMIVFY